MDFAGDRDLPFDAAPIEGVPLIRVLNHTDCGVRFLDDPLPACGGLIIHIDPPDAPWPCFRSIWDLAGLRRRPRRGPR